jgi:hypothetical protein
VGQAGAGSATRAQGRRRIDGLLAASGRTVQDRNDLQLDRDHARFSYLVRQQVGLARGCRVHFELEGDHLEVRACWLDQPLPVVVDPASQWKP